MRLRKSKRLAQSHSASMQQMRMGAQIHLPVCLQQKTSVLFLCGCVQSLQWCLTLWDPMDCSLPDSSVHGILQARILELVAIAFSRGSSRPRDQTLVSCISCIAGRFFTPEPRRKPYQGSNLCLPCWEWGVLTTGPSGKSHEAFYSQEKPGNSAKKELICQKVSIQDLRQHFFFF